MHASNVASLPLPSPRVRRLSIALALLFGCGVPTEPELLLSEQELVGTVGGLKGLYFNNDSRTGSPALARVDPAVNFTFGEAKPDPLITAANFSAVWSGRLTPTVTANYTFFIRSGDSFRQRTGLNDDGPGDRVRLLINGTEVINSFGGNGRTEVRGTFRLAANVEHTLVLEYAKRQTIASVRLLWANDLPAEVEGRLQKQVIASKFLLPPSDLPSPFVDADVGSRSRRQGFSQLTEAGAILAHGSGAAIGGTADTFYFVHQPLESDGEVVARLTGNLSVRTGVMFRENLTTGARRVFFGVDGRNSGVTPLFSRRDRAGGDSETSTLRSRGLLSTEQPLWFKLSRKGDTFEAFLSEDGKTFTKVGQDTVEMAGRAFVGIASTGAFSREATATFDNVKVDRDYAFLVRDGIASEASSNQYYASMGVAQGFTLDQFIATRMVGPNVRAYFRNEWDLGFWREMNCTETLDRGRGGCWVRNWSNEQDRFDPTKDDLGTVAMDISAEGFTRFYVFGPDGVLSPKAVLDAEGAKFAPELCTTCHGGAYVPGANNPDLGSVFREFEPSLLVLRSDLARRGSEGRRIADREFARLNRAIRSANLALRKEPEGGAPGITRAVTAMLGHLDAIYQTTPGLLERPISDGDNPRPLNVRSSDPAQMPATWATDVDPALQTAKRELWSTVVNPYCMNCHRFNSVDFTNYAAFEFLGNPFNITPGNPRGERSLLRHYLRGAVFENAAGQRTVLSVMPQSEQMMRNLGLRSAEDDDVRGPLRGNRFGELDKINQWLSNHQRVKGLPLNLR